VREGENLYTGSVVVLDAASGAYRNHFKIVARDWHDWDVSAAPAIITTRAGRKLLSLAPKDGYVYGFDLTTNKLLYRTPATRIQNADVPFPPIIRLASVPAREAVQSGTGLPTIRKPTWFSLARLSGAQL
jgi:alcohol dehydrogenase (cytochrome c)